MAGIPIDELINNYHSPSSIGLAIPVAGEGSMVAYKRLCGILTSDVAFSMSNKWGPVLSDVSNLTDISAILGDSEIFSWIGASTQCWKGTDPIKIDVEFYLVNYRKGLGLEEGLRALAKLTSLTKADGRFDSLVKVMAHGGYMADVLSMNKDMFSNARWEDLKQGKAKSSSGTPMSLDFYSSSVLSRASDPGTVTIQVGSKIEIGNLLVTRLDIVPSLVEVADQTGDRVKPLYYRVSVGFTGVRPLLSTDVDKMFNI